MNRAILKGRLNKPICAIMTSLILVFSFFSLALPYQEADADGSAFVLITIFKKGVFQAGFANTGSCVGNICNVVIDTSNRYEALFKRDCGSPLAVAIPATSTSQEIVDCANARGPWHVEVSAQLNASHGSIVTVNVFPT